MQTTLAATAAVREERASQDFHAASTTDVDIAVRDKKAAPKNLRATYPSSTDAEADLAEQENWRHNQQLLSHNWSSGVVVALRDGEGELMMPFAGFFEDVSYPVTTLFYPPRPPGEMPPRVKLPPRPGPVYKNDLALCGERENEAQILVSKTWRGILTRRFLVRDRIFQDIINYRARSIQCWWRSLKARHRYAQLVRLKKEWLATRAAEYVQERQQSLLNIMTWQRFRFEGAAVTIQRVVRWHLARCARERCEAEGVPADQWPPARPFPLEHTPARYFPWRRSTAGVADTDGAAAAAAATAESDRSKEEPPRRRTLLEFRKERAPVPPPPQTAVEEGNATMRRKMRERAVSLAQPEAQSRKEWKQEGLKKEDLDFNAGVIQRLYRTKQSSTKVRTAELTKSYMDKIVRIIARSFRMYILVQRLQENRRRVEHAVRKRLAQYSNARIADVEHKMVWGKELLDASARTIQQCWHWYRYTRFGIIPLRIQKEMDHHEALLREKQQLGEQPDAETEDLAEALEEPYQFEEPTPPPYRLIDDYLSREEELRDAMLNLLQRNEKVMGRSRKYTKFTPEKPIVRKDVHTFIPKSN